MPTHNRGYVIWKAICSVVSQTYSDWELIVVDDGSTDDTGRLLEEFDDSRIRVRKVQQGGPSRARNLGVELASGKFVAYLDSDNIWEPRFLETFSAAIEANPDAAIWHCGRFVAFWERDPGRPWKLIHDDCQTARRLTENDIWNFETPDVNCLVHRREVLSACGGWDENCSWIEDWDLFVRLWLVCGGRSAHVPDPLVRYRQIHGAGADGICAERREDPEREIAARTWIIDKWKNHPRFRAELLAVPDGVLEPLRAVQHAPAVCSSRGE